MVPPALSLWMALFFAPAAGASAGAELPPPRATADCPDPWDLERARAEWAWARAGTRGINSPRIAVLDAGFRSDHVDLAGRISSSWDHVAQQEAVSVTGGPSPEHGSFAAGVAVAADNEDVARTGFAPEARLHLAQIAGADGRLSMTAAVEALDGLAAGDWTDVGVVLLPWTTDNSSRTLQEAIAALEDADLLVVAAAGSCGEGCDNPDLDSAPVYPAGWRMDHQLVVTATDRDDALATDARTGRRSVDLGAPGVDLCSLGVDSPPPPPRPATAAMPPPPSPGSPPSSGRAARAERPEVAALLRASASPAPALSGLSRSGGRLDADRAFQVSIPRLHIGESAPGQLSLDIEGLGQDGDLVLIFEHHDEVFIDAVLEPAGYAVAALLPGDPVPLPDASMGAASQPGSLVQGPLPAGQTLHLVLSVAGSAAGTGSVRGGSTSPGAPFLATPIRGDTVDGNDAPAFVVDLQPLPLEAGDSGGAPPGPTAKEGCGCAQAGPQGGGALGLLALLLAMARRKGSDDEGDDADSPGSVRADKWLWAARCFKTRSQATEACDAGHCKINDSVAKPAQKLRPGDRVEILCPAGRKHYEVVALADRRGSAEAAAALFIDHTPEEPKVERDLLFEIERGEGRPTKRDRRRLSRTRGW